MKKIVIGQTNNSIFDVEKGRECIVLKSFWYNGESWYVLKDINTNEKFESPDVFWKSEND
jgi:hypothetical protein